MVVSRVALLNRPSPYRGEGEKAEEKGPLAGDKDIHAKTAIAVKVRKGT